MRGASTHTPPPLTLTIASRPRSEFCGLRTNPIEPPVGDHEGLDVPVGGGRPRGFAPRCDADRSDGRVTGCRAVHEGDPLSVRRPGRLDVLAPVSDQEAGV